MSRKLQVGIIGGGGIARLAHIPGYLAAADRCEVVAICDPVIENAEKLAKEFLPGAKIYSDYRDLLKDKQIEAVSVATPNKFHKQPTIDALNSGKHVLCEKPLAMNAGEAKEMCRAAKKSGKLLQVALQFRFNSNVKFLKDFVDHGHMGEIYYARAKALRRRGVPGWGVFIDKEKQGGGPLIDIGVHILDITLHLMGYPKPLRASGRTWDMLGKDPSIRNFWGDYNRSKFTVEDFATGIVHFENGASLVLESSFMANMEGDPFESQLFGTKAGAILRTSGDQPIRIFKEFDQQYFNMVPEIPTLPHTAHVTEVIAFVDAILSGKPSPVPGEQGLALNAIIDALYLSSELDREVEIDTSL